MHRELAYSTLLVIGNWSINLNTVEGDNQRAPHHG
jgi:hypothetical protein